MNIKALLEQRAAVLTAMEALVTLAGNEKRAFSDTETADFEAKKKEADALEATIKAADQMRSFEKFDFKGTDSGTDSETKEQAEVRAFGEFIRGVYNEKRSDVDFTKSDNGALIPSTIANKIITKVVEICPIYSMATRYNVGGTLTIPYYDEDTTAITMAYATEFAELESTAGKFASISMTGFLAGVLSLISKSLINNSNFDVVGVVIERMAVSIAKWIENELLTGTSGKITGLSTVATGVTAASTTAITADELIDLQESIPDAYQANAVWIMSKSLRTAIRKLKDGDGNYLLNKDASARWGYTLFGKDIYVSANMPTPAAGKTAIYYGDFTGLAVKLSEDVAIQVLMEKYATQHAVGINAWVEIDSKVENAQKLTKLVMKAS